jgi:hypothetical protein
MRNAKTVTAELVRSETPARIIQPQDMKAVLDQLVRERVAEALAERDGSILEPWFQTKSVAYEIRRLQTMVERKSKSLYFEKYGCIHCHKKKHRHACSGICEPCYGKIAERLRVCQRQLQEEYDERTNTRITDTGDLAKECLRSESASDSAVESRGRK